MVNTPVITAPTILADIATPGQNGRKPLMQILDEMVAENSTSRGVSSFTSPSGTVSGDLFTRMSADPSMTSQLVPQTTTTNQRGFSFGAVNVSVNGAEKDILELSNEVAGQFMSAIQHATFTDLDLT